MRVAQEHDDSGTRGAAPRGRADARDGARARASRRPGVRRPQRGELAAVLVARREVVGARPRRCRGRAWRGAWRAAGPTPLRNCSGVASPAMRSRAPPRCSGRRPAYSGPIGCLMLTPSCYKRGRVRQTTLRSSQGVSMAQRCDVCGKGPSVGHKISHAHNVTKRRWLAESGLAAGHGQAARVAAAARLHPLPEGRQGHQGRLAR